MRLLDSLSSEALKEDRSLRTGFKKTGRKSWCTPTTPSGDALSGLGLRKRLCVDFCSQVDPCSQGKE